MTLDQYTAAQIEAMTDAEATEKHRLAHNTLHGFYNGALADRGIVYVHPDGSDGNKGRSWTLPKATIAGAQAAGGSESLILVGQGAGDDEFEVNESIELVDGQLIQGISPHASSGTFLRATASLGTDPAFTNASGNLSSGGLRGFHLRGTEDANGGVGILIPGSAISENWIFDNMTVRGFTSHGIHFDIPSGQTAGNPLRFGYIGAFNNGQGGTGDGIRVERPNSAIVHFDFISGDDNAGSLLYLETLNTATLVNILTMKAERRTDGTHDDVVTVATANGGAVRIGALWVFHNVSSGTDANAFIKETGGTSLRFQVGHAYISEPGSNSYTYGFDDGTDQITVSDFVRKPWFWYPTLGLEAPGTYTPMNVTTTRSFDANAAASAADLAGLKVVVEELADVVGTMIADDQTLGVRD